MSEQERSRILRRIENAEALAPAGSAAHTLYVQAALMSELPRIKAILSTVPPTETGARPPEDA